MTLSYVTVSIITGRLPGCIPAGGGFVDFTLTGSDVDGALIVPMRVRAPLDATGAGSAQLWPPARGLNGVQYRAEVFGPNGSPLLWTGTCTPPQADCALHDIIDLDAPPAADTRDRPNGFVGLTGLAINVWNAGRTALGTIASAATAARAWVLPDRSGTVALLDDIPDVSGVAPLEAPALTGPATLNGQPVCTVPTAQGAAIVAAIIFGA